MPVIGRRGLKLKPNGSFGGMLVAQPRHLATLTPHAGLGKMAEHLDLRRRGQHSRLPTSRAHHNPQRKD